MLTEFQRRKLTRLFHVYDMNRDGIVERGDYDHVAAGIADFLGLQRGSAERDRHTDEYMARWDQVQKAVDHDGDNRVTLDEFIAANALILPNREIFDVVILQSTENIMRYQDMDEDGRITRYEYLGVALAHAITSDEAEEAFDYLDRDGDGFITKEELLRDTEDFFLSNDPDVPGNWLVGRY